MKTYDYQCPTCETIISQEENMAEHSYKNPGPQCLICKTEMLHKIYGSPMFSMMWTDPHK
jgi:hypothetical protein